MAPDSDEQQRVRLDELRPQNPDKDGRPGGHTYDRQQDELRTAAEAVDYSKVQSGVGSAPFKQPIAGYRNLSPAEIELINTVKRNGMVLQELVGMIAATPGIDQRWVAIGRTHLQEGLMALTRAIARPEGF